MLQYSLKIQRFYKPTMNRITFVNPSTVDISYFSNNFPLKSILLLQTLNQSRNLLLNRADRPTYFFNLYQLN